MIYLKKDGAKVTTNDEEVAAMFEADGYTRIRGWRKWALVIGTVAKEVALEWAFPACLGVVVFHLCDGREYAAFIIGAYAVYILSGLFSD